MKENQILQLLILSVFLIKNNFDEATKYLYGKSLDSLFSAVKFEEALATISK